MSVAVESGKTLTDYAELVIYLRTLDKEEARLAIRELAQTDLFFLLRYVLKRADAEHPWILARCQEVQESPDGHVDLWAREHYKSTIITFALTIQNIIVNPEITIGIFSHTRPQAKGFLRQIMRELEGNQLLKELFPDILWVNPRKEAPKWSEDDGFIVKRVGNPKEATVEAWGLVDGMPTGKHFATLTYDDVVTVESVRSPEMIIKTTEALELSYNLGVAGGVRRFIGTRYHSNDSYKVILDRGTARPRIHTATDTGKGDGEPVFLDAEVLADKRRDMGSYTFACQMLQNPFEEGKQGFKREWLRYYTTPQTGVGMNVYCVVDPASKKKKKSDYTAIWVVGTSPDGNYYVLDFLRDKLSLTERADAVFRLHRKWKPIATGYEEYGLQADVEHLQDRMERENYRFSIIRLGGRLGKDDRILRLVPLFQRGQIYLPKTLMYANSDGVAVNIVDTFVENEFTTFPVPTHDDMLDALARITDTEFGVTFPTAATRINSTPYVSSGGWL